MNHAAVAATAVFATSTRRSGRMTVLLVANIRRPRRFVSIVFAAPPRAHWSDDHHGPESVTLSERTGPTERVVLAVPPDVGDFEASERETPTRAARDVSVDLLALRLDEAHLVVVESFTVRRGASA